MFHFSFDFVDAIDGEDALSLISAASVFRNDAFCASVSDDGQFDIQPALVFVLVLPDLAHSRARVSRRIMLQL